MTPVAIIRQGTGETLTLDGATVLDVDVARDVPEHRVEALYYVQDTVIPRPRRYVISAVVSPIPGLRGLTQGDARLAEVLDFLARTEGQIVDLSWPGQTLIRDLTVMSFPYSTGRTTSLDLTISLVEVRIATARSVTVSLEGSRRAAPSTPPRADVAAGQADTQDLGQVQPSRSYLETGRQATLRAIGLGP